MAKSPQRIDWPVDAAERIAAARRRGATFNSIGAEFGLSGKMVRDKAIALGLHRSAVRPRFTAGDDRIIRADYAAHVEVASTAAKLGRSPDAVRQRIFHRFKDLLGRRTRRSWRAFRRYGAAMLAHGATPDQAAARIYQVMRAATAQARASAAHAKARRRRERIDLMLGQIAAGRKRDAAMFEARSAGATLDEIGRAIGVSRERVRQICDRYGFELATDRLLHAAGADAASAAEPSA